MTEWDQEYYIQAGTQTISITWKVSLCSQIPILSLGDYMQDILKVKCP